MVKPVQVEKIEGELDKSSAERQLSISPEICEAFDRERVVLKRYNEQNILIKTVGVEVDGKMYQFSRDHLKDNPEWSLDILGEVNEETGEHIIEQTLYFDKNVDREYLEELFSQDIPQGLREVLKSSRQVSYTDYGDTKVLTVVYGGKTYEFLRNLTNEWKMDIYNSNGEFERSQQIEEELDNDYLQELSEKDITDNIKNILNENRTLSYDNDLGRVVVSAIYNNQTYKFYPEDSELPTEDDPSWVKWFMEIEDEAEENLHRVEIVQKSDCHYLTKLLHTPTREQTIDQISKMIKNGKIEDLKRAAKPAVFRETVTNGYTQVEEAPEQAPQNIFQTIGKFLGRLLGRR